MSSYSIQQRGSQSRQDLAPLGTSSAATNPLRVTNPLQVWFSECVDDAFALIERRANSFRGGLIVVASAQEEADRAKRYQLIDTLLHSPSSLAGGTGRQLLQDIIAGFLYEFSRQTLLSVPPLNIANPERPQPIAKAYWESRPKEQFERQRFPGVHHTARSYQRLLQEHFFAHNDRGSTTGRKAAWDATSELLRASIDTFRARGAEVFPDRELRASIYNDHLYVIAFARKTLCVSAEQFERAA